MRIGLINNVLYVIILSAALDLVGTDVPKGVVLLADVTPSFLAKLLAPSLNIHKVPYAIRVLVFALLSTCGMLLIALTPETKDGGTVAVKMSGVVVASLSSGGETGHSGVWSGSGKTLKQSRCKCNRQTSRQWYYDCSIGRSSLYQYTWRYRTRKHSWT